MSFHRKELRRVNELLAGANYGPVSARPDSSHARYQWCWSQELMTATPVMNGEEPVMEYICSCGVDRAVHLPHCKMSLASVKFVKVPVEPGLPNCFILCTWLAPPSEEKWASIYGSFRYYPSQGRYVPLNFSTPQGPNYMLTPYPHVPDMETTQRIINAIRDNHEKETQRQQDAILRGQLRDAVKTRDYTPPANSQWQRRKDFFKDRMTWMGERPGKRGGPISYPTGVSLIGDARDERLAPEAHLSDTLAKPLNAPMIQLAQ